MNATNSAQVDVEYVTPGIVYMARKHRGRHGYLYRVSVYDIQSDLRKAGATARIFRRFAQDCILKDLKMDPTGRTLSCGSTLLTIYRLFIDYFMYYCRLENVVQFYVIISIVYRYYNH